jgi:hypothetical protein
MIVMLTRRKVLFAGKWGTKDAPTSDKILVPVPGTGSSNLVFCQLNTLKLRAFS